MIEEKTINKVLEFVRKTLLEIDYVNITIKLNDESKKQIDVIVEERKRFK